MNNMKRVIWVGVTILIMIAIMGLGLHTLNNISEVNRRRHEKEEGEKFASQIIVTEGTTNVWDAIREEQTTTGAYMSDEDGNIMTDENGDPIPLPSETEPAESVQQDASEPVQVDVSVQTDAIGISPTEAATSGTLETVSVPDGPAVVLVP